MCVRVQLRKRAECLYASGNNLTRKVKLSPMQEKGDCLRNKGHVIRWTRGAGGLGEQRGQFSLCIRGEGRAYGLRRR